MADVAIRVAKLGKQYKIGPMQQRYAYKTLREVITDSVMWGPIRYLRGQRRDRSNDTIWALRDVSFEIKRGDVVGVIGRNGAGKTTLLKILSRVAYPTEGFAEIHGRVGSLLEVGTGFHPELTGRENIYLNGAILGMKKVEIDQRFDEIVSFAEIEKFIDTPVKHYSSGMYLRLAFAVAAHLEPEILLVDEVLAVGDVPFQKKCLGKMGDVAKAGRTVLFVSHNMAAIRQLCPTGILLQSGAVLCNGPVLECVNQYLENVPNPSGSILNHITKIDPEVEINSITVNNSSGDQLELAADSQQLKIEITGRIHRPMRLEVEARISDLYDTPLAFFSPGHERGYTEVHPVGHFRLVRNLDLPRVMRGAYYLSLYLTNPNVDGWVDIPRAVRLLYGGTPTATGLTFDYGEGRGWILLSGVTDDTEEWLERR